MQTEDDAMTEISADDGTVETQLTRMKELITKKDEDLKSILQHTQQLMAIFLQSDDTKSVITTATAQTNPQLGQAAGDSVQGAAQPGDPTTPSTAAGDLEPPAAGDR